MDKQELVRLYTDGRRDFSEVDLTGAALSGVCLTDAHLYGADLAKANLAGSNLTGIICRIDLGERQYEREVCGG